MQMEKLLTLGTIQNKQLLLLENGRFFYDRVLPGAWLAAYTPLDGAFLLTTDPPDGFLGLKKEDFLVDTQAKPWRFDLPHNAGIECSLECSPAPSPENRAETTSDPFLASFIFRTINRTANPLPVSFAFSWQDLNRQAPSRTTGVNNSLALSFSENHYLRVKTGHAKARFTYNSGWNPEGDGSDIWDDYFSSGELGNQTYASYAGAACCYLLLAPRQDGQVVFSLGI